MFAVIIHHDERHLSLLWLDWLFCVRPVSRFPVVVLFRCQYQTFSEFMLVIYGNIVVRLLQIWAFRTFEVDPTR